jgi:hypothetical protein
MLRLLVGLFRLPWTVQRLAADVCMYLSRWRRQQQQQQQRYVDCVTHRPLLLFLARTFY